MPLELPRFLSLWCFVSWSLVRTDALASSSSSSSSVVVEDRAYWSAMEEGGVLLDDDHPRLRTFARRHLDRLRRCDDDDERPSYPTAPGQVCDVPFPGLRARPWWRIDEDDDAFFPWARGLERSSRRVVEETRTAVSSSSSFDDDDWVGSRTALCRDTTDFARLELRNHEGAATEAGRDRFPRTLELLEDRLRLFDDDDDDDVGAVAAPRPVSINRQGPRSGLAPHTDNANVFLVCHLGLIVPRDERCCWFAMRECGDDDDDDVIVESRRSWRPGKVLIADTSFVHRTRNDSDSEDRYVLHFNVWHPDLTREERRGIVDMHKVLQEFEVSSSDGDGA